MYSCVRVCFLYVYNTYINTMQRWSVRHTHIYKKKTKKLTIYIHMKSWQNLRFGKLSLRDVHNRIRANPSPDESVVRCFYDTSHGMRTINNRGKRRNTAHSCGGPGGLAAIFCLGDVYGFLRKKSLFRDQKEKNLFELVGNGSFSILDDTYYA